MIMKAKEQKTMKSAFALLLLLPLLTVAQPSARPDDQFFRRKVVNRIDLQEKVNQPLVHHQGPYYGSQQQAPAEGMIAGLLQGLREGRYVAYDPGDLTRAMSYEEVLTHMRDFADQFVSDDGWYEAEREPWEIEDAWIAPDSADLSPETLLDNLGSTTPKVTDPLADLSAYEHVIQFVEDRYFDQVRGHMVYRPDWIQLIWSDPGETLPEEFLAVFRYSDVAETLDQIPWYNRFNDAETRSLPEVFELRIFHAYLIEVSGHGLQSLADAEYQRRKLVEFEHHLWSY